MEIAPRIITNKREGNITHLLCLAERGKPGGHGGCSL
jgi:hypothetical protein